MPARTRSLQLVTTSPLPLDRDGLRTALREAYPWLDATDVGPRAVSAGECDRCGDEARLVATCGPVEWRELGRACAQDLGLEAWCDGHEDEARTALRWLAALPDEADDVTRLWWVATGEVQLDPALLRRRLEALPRHLR